MKKLFYILPEYEAGTSAHFRYNVEFLEEVAKKARVFLFIEKGERPITKNIQKIHVGKFRNLFLRFLERKLVFTWARLCGYGKFYSHYAIGSALLAGLICRLSGGQLYFWHCEQRGEYELQDCGLCSWPQKIVRDWPFRIVLRLSHRLVTCTDKMKSYYHEVFAVPLKKIQVMPNWVDVEAFEKLKNEVPANPTLLFVHWLSPRKGSRILPDLFEKVRSIMPEARLTVVGEGPDYNWLEAEWEKRGLKSFVKMKGAVPNQKIAAEYMKADILLHPSREEEFGRVLIEAMAAGLPIVASRTLGAEAILSARQKKWSFDYANVKEGAELCVKLLQSKENRKALKEEGFRVVQNYDKSVVIPRFLQVLGL